MGRHCLGAHQLPRLGLGRGQFHGQIAAAGKERRWRCHQAAVAIHIVLIGVANGGDMSLG